MLLPLNLIVNPTKTTERISSEQSRIKGLGTELKTTFLHESTKRRGGVLSLESEATFLHESKRGEEEF